MLKRTLKFLASLKLTVTLMVMAMILVFAGTIAQIDMGIWDVQRKYFHTAFTWIDLPLFLRRPLPSWWPGFLSAVPFLGGYMLGLLLLINLLAAHLVRFKFSLTRIGIILIHAGLIMLLVGEGITSRLAVETQMSISEGSSIDYAQDIREPELVVIDPSDPKHDQVHAIRASKLYPDSLIDDPRLPFQVRIEGYYPNSRVRPLRHGEPPISNAGRGHEVRLMEVRKVSGTESGTDIPGAYATILHKGRPLGTYLLWTGGDLRQSVRVEGKEYLLELRFRRYYKPFRVHLLDFRFDRYTGTDTPRNFSSHIHIKSPDGALLRDVIIRMNEPLRFQGSAYYQAAHRDNETTSVLQVVDNPGWLIPYVACCVTGAGLLIHFLIMLFGFLERVSAQRAGMPPPLPAAALGKAARTRSTPRKPVGGDGYTLPARHKLLGVHTILPALAVLICALYLLSHLRPVKSIGGFDLDSFSKLPVSYEGRVQPLDSLARNSLRVLSGKSELRTGDERQPPIQWLIDMMANHRKAHDYQVFRIVHPQAISLLRLDEKRKSHLYSWNEVIRSAGQLEQQVLAIEDIPSRQLDVYQKEIRQLNSKLHLYRRIAEMHLHLAYPDGASNDWQDAHQARNHPGLESLGKLLATYHQHHNPQPPPGHLAAPRASADYPAAFNRQVKEYRTLLDQKLPATMIRVRFEALYNRLDPMYYSMFYYTLVFLLISICWLTWSGRGGEMPVVAPVRSREPDLLRRCAFAILILTFLLHTFGILARIYISGRPPVTNLYSSAIFIAYVAVLIAILLEWLFRNGLGIGAAAVLGALSLVVGYNLMGDGDTMKVLQAVLDTNIWLATHVVMITMGYAAAFLAGFLGIAYVFLGVFTRALTPSASKTLARCVYGVLCFAMLNSFIGTVLGGIWADQSWGRFWGWDPKENGAVLIVLWIAIILHARWAGLAREQGIAVLAIAGNIVTAWSWFGTNQMGVGLHAYGFMDRASVWLLLFVGSQLLVMTIGSLPADIWRSFRPRVPPLPPPAAPGFDPRS